MKSRNFVGVTYLKILSAERLRDMDEPLIVCCHSQPVAALVPYDRFLKIQEALEAVRKADEEYPRLGNNGQLRALVDAALAGLQN